MNLEALLLACLLSLGIVPLLVRVRRAGIRAAAMVAALLGSGLSAWAAINARVVPLAEEEVELRPVAIRDEGFTSSRACQSCHPEQYASWRATYHRTMTQVATPETVVGDFGENGVTLTAYGRTERFWRDGDEFWIERENPLWRPAGIEDKRIQRPIVLTTGSHNLQFYWYSTGHSREVGLGGFVYVIADQRWIPYTAEGMTPPHPPGADLAPATGAWNRGCIHCHTTRGKMRIQPNPVRPANPLEPHKNILDTQVTEFGISCEACHGAGERHVVLNRDPQVRYRAYFGDGDSSIVNPERLSSRQSTQICGQCHGVVLTFNPSEHGRAQQRLSKHGFRFRPGDELGDTRTIVDPSDPNERELALVLKSQPHFLEERFWSDGMVRVTGREMNGLMQSPCFRNGHEDGDISCLSCHSLHQASDDPRSLKTWANDMLKPGMDGDRACLQCHSKYAADAEAHTHHADGGAGSECQNCHMPFTSYGLLKAIRSHTIDSPDVKASVETGRPNACNQCHLDQTLEWAAAKLETWYGVTPPPLERDERSVPAGILWLLKGDAGQRALMAWSMGWDAAREASGDEWMGEFLAVLLEDPYANVRYIADRSLRELPGFADFEYDYIADAETRATARVRALGRWRAGRIEAGEPTTGLHLLHDPEGSLPPDVFARLLADRDDRRVVLKE